MKVVAIVQARMGSSRFPGKMTQEILGRPIIDFVITRLKAAKKVNDICLATTNRAEDDVLADWAKKNGVNCYRGSSDDVLDRYYNAALELGAEVVVRITGDCPLLDPEVVDDIVGSYLAGGFDYVSNTIEPTYPDGYDTEVFSFAALEVAWKDAKLASEREHVTPYIKNHPELFKLKNILYKQNLAEFRCTLDYPDDLELIKNVFMECGRTQSVCGLPAVAEILLKNKELRELNRSHTRDEGYAKSLAEDKKVK